MKILITGAAGFIGYHLTNRLLEEKSSIVGIDNLNDYYDVSLKHARLNELGIQKGGVKSSVFDNFTFHHQDICNKEFLGNLFATEKFDVVINLAAQAGVRYSLINPQAYIDSNIQGFLNILEACRQFKPKHLIFASSSSVYGLNHQIPFSAHHHTDHPVSLYAATKKANEMMAHSYAHLFGIPVSGLRFFTVYGPWGRPDMAYFSFTKKILHNESIEVFNNGELMRDFTYIDDVVEGIRRLIDKPPKPDESFDNLNPDPSTSSAPYRMYNIGNHEPVKLLEFINNLEEIIGEKAQKVFKPMQPGDVYTTYADVSALYSVCGFQPKTPLKYGLQKFVDWYRGYYQ
jgi:UDP-glucuronate 4-epimerase